MPSRSLWLEASYHSCTQTRDQSPTDMSSRQIPLPRNDSSIFRSGWIDNPGLLVLLVVETRPLNHLLVGISRLFLVKANIKFLGDLPIR